MQLDVHTRLHHPLPLSLDRRYDVASCVAIVAFARELGREDGHRRLSKFLSRVKVCGPTQLWRDGISGARRAATEFRPSNGEEGSVKLIRFEVVDRLSSGFFNACTFHSPIIAFN